MFNKLIPKRSFSSVLKAKVETKLKESQAVLLDLKKNHGTKKIGDVTIGSVIQGMRGMTGLVYDTSKLDAINGISYRGHDLFTFCDKAPKLVEGGQPLPEACLWLLLTGEYPT